MERGKEYFRHRRIVRSEKRKRHAIHKRRIYRGSMSYEEAKKIAERSNNIDW